MTPPETRTGSFARRVFDARDADVVFVPFFATLSAEMQLGTAKGLFRKKDFGNEDYRRQREVLDSVKKTEAWKRSGGRDHVFVLTGIYIYVSFFCLHCNCEFVIGCGMLSVDVTLCWIWKLVACDECRLVRKKRF